MKSKNQIRVFHIVGGLPIGGAEVLLLNTVRRMKPLGYELYVCSLTDKGDIGPEIIDLGIPVFSLLSNPHVYNFKVLISLFRLFRDIKPHIVQTHIYPSNTLGRIAAFLSRVPVIIATEHGFYRWKKSRQILIDRCLSYISDRIVVISKGVQDYLHKRSGIRLNKFQLLYNFVDPEQLIPQKKRLDVRRELGLNENDIILGSVGRLVWDKGYHILLKAFKLVIDKDKDVKLVLVGDGPYSDVLKEKSRLYAIQDHVIFLGNRRDIPDLLNIMDLFVLPTLDEGFGISIIEALLFNLPVIATNIDAVPEIIEDGVNGLLVPPKDPVALGNAINRLLENRTLSKNLGRAGNEIVRKKYNSDVQINRIDSFYRSLLKEKT